MPSPVGIEVEGSSDENLMVLPATIEQKEFDILLEYMFRGRTAAPPSLDNLIVILKLSTMLEIDDGRTYAIDQLSKRADLTSALQFHLGCAHHVTEWVEPAFRALMKIPFKDISREIAHLMGPDAFYILSQAHTAIRDHLNILTFYPSNPIESVHCFRPGRCTEAWIWKWWQGVAKHLLHPDSGKSGREILGMLEEVKQTGVMTKADEYFEGAVEQIVAAYGSRDKGKAATTALEDDEA
ncbi:hypothetical protein GLOTRDRAFT_93257 [Gloeophyllum trabeum ATCC 11539]|uniref:BTB domain-containing protein n=1 Tax=Gloeophyllum trabeum (strain ATCC 11539 / FP-39264 / Madison 617) TaxID=670483 RepID=S7Q823_GLOTA|nr:uncharacterized protein GLOTRDRAFT_93257 [Gloeophyllum trabeum ATCC 11539]EPQ55677.1 hypothetical protein GLOTRDRAFT_93257 [Gloeophyllum trabeum ATCC 11539]